MIALAGDCHAGPRRTIELEIWRIGDALELHSAIIIGAITGQIYPALVLIMHHEEMFGLIRITISSPVVIECERDVALAVLSDERKVV